MYLHLFVFCLSVGLLVLTSMAYIMNICMLFDSKVIHTKYSKHHPYTVAHNKSWIKSWVIYFTFEAYKLPHTLNCI